MGKCEHCIVREFSSLKVLNKEELLRIADCKTSMTVRKGSSLFKEGDPVNGVFCVKDGVCKMTKLGENGKDQIVKLVKKGELLGHRAMISDEPANLSAVALEDMQVCFIPKSEILGFLDGNRDFSRNMLKTICGDLREADDLMVNMAQQTVTARLAHTLLYLEETFGTDGHGMLRLQLSREEFGAITGTATESAIRLLSAFRKAGMIALSGKKIRLLDKAQLKKAAHLQ